MSLAPEGAVAHADVAVAMPWRRTRGSVRRMPTGRQIGLGAIVGATGGVTVPRLPDGDSLADDLHGAVLRSK